MSDDGGASGATWEETEACLDQVVGNGKVPIPVERGAFAAGWNPRNLPALSTPMRAAQGRRLRRSGRARSHGFHLRRSAVLVAGR